MEPDLATSAELVAAVNLGSERDQRALTPAASKALVRLAEFWKLSAADMCGLLGGLSERSWYRIKSGSFGRMDQDTLTRASALIGIYKGLHLLFSQPLADEWVRRPNRHPLFRGRTPVQAMIEDGIPRMVDVRSYVDALRGGS